MAQWLISGSAELQAGSRTTASPNRTFDSYRANKSAAEGYVYLQNAVSVTANQDYVFSVFVKSDTASKIIVRLGAGINDNYSETSFSLEQESIEAGPISVGSAISNTVSSIQEVGDGWYSIQSGFRTTLDKQFNVFVTSRVGPSETLTGDDTGVSSFFFWNASLERRRLRINPSYLGSSQDFRLSIPDITYTFLPLWRPETSAVSYTNRFTGGSEFIDVTNVDLQDTTDYNTSDSVEYVRIPANPNHGFPNEVTIYDNRGNTNNVTIERQDVYERREPIQITFLNKEGVLEDLWAIRRSTENLETRADEYYRNVIDYNSLTYDTFSHVNRRYNVVSQKGIVVETDFIPESYNSFFEQLYNSELAWLTFDGVTRPVNLDDSSFTYKTHVNDKLVQYRLRFSTAHRLDNTIR